jgi:hypothetical protein
LSAFFSVFWSPFDGCKESKQDANYYSCNSETKAEIEESKEKANPLAFLHNRRINHAHTTNHTKQNKISGLNKLKNGL